MVPTSELPAPGAKRQSLSQHVLDDTLTGLQEVSDLLQESLAELQSNKASSDESKMCNETQHKSSETKSQVVRKVSKEQAVPVPPPRSSSSRHNSPMQSPARPRRRSDVGAPPVRKLSRDMTPPTNVRKSPSPSVRVPSASPRQRRRRKSSSGRNKSPVTAVQSKADHNSHTPYFKSSIADKMSDYEDIWIDTLPKHQQKTQLAKYKFLTEASIEQNDSVSLLDRERSITPAESENNFKAYLAQKLLEDKNPSAVIKEETATMQVNSSTSSTATSSCSKISSLGSSGGSPMLTSQRSANAASSPMQPLRKISCMGVSGEVGSPKSSVFKLSSPSPVSKRSSSFSSTTHSSNSSSSSRDRKGES